MTIDITDYLGFSKYILCARYFAKSIMHVILFYFLFFKKIY
jgi:hypothetical protein